MPDVADLRVKVSLDGEQEVAAGLKQADSAVTSFAANAGKAGGAIGGMAKDFAAFGLVAGGVVVAGVGKAVSTFADFEHGMSAVKAASGATAAQMAQLGAAAIALGADTQLAGIDATDAATAMAELARGGVSVADQLGGATRGALLLASAGAISVGDAAGIATKAMNIFGLSGADVAHVADLLSAGANKSATDVGHLGDAFNQSAAVAKNAGLDIETLTGTLAFLAQRGLEGSDAGTSLKTALLALQAPTDVAAKTMRDLGINVRDAQGHMLPFADIADVLKDRLAGLSEAQRDAALKTIFGNDAIRVGIALYEGGGSAIRDWTANVNDAGSAARTGATLNDNLKGSLDQLGAVVQTAAIQVGAKFAPAIRTAADELGTFVTKAMASPEVTKALEDLGTRGAAALTALIAKVSDPAFQSELRKWGTTALDVATTIKGLAGDIAGTLGPPLQAAAGWFSSLDDQGRKNVVMFGLVAGAAVKFRDELGTLKGVVEDVIGAFARKEAAKKSLQAANEGLAGSAGKTATAMEGTGSAAAAAAIELAGVAAVTVTAGAAAVGLVYGVSAAADALDRGGQRAKDNAQAWDAASFAIAHGGTEANGAVDAFTRLTISAGVQAGDIAGMSVLWNQYVASLQASGQSTDTLGLQMVNLAQFITGQVAPAFESAANSGSSYNNTIVGLGSAALALGNSLPTMGAGAATATAAFAAGVVAVQDYNSALAQLEANGVVTTQAVQGTANVLAGYQVAIAAAAAQTQDYATAAAIAEGDTGEFGTAVGVASSNLYAYGQALDAANKQIASIGSTAGTLKGYLQILQQQWDQLNVATDNGKHVTADQQAAYDRLAPAIQYLNGQLGVLATDQTTAALSAVQNYEAVQNQSAAYQTASGAATQASTALQAAATASRASEIAAVAASNQYNEFGQSITGATTATSGYTSSAQAATGATGGTTSGIGILRGAMAIASTVVDALAGSVDNYSASIAAVPATAVTTFTAPGVVAGTADVETLHGAINAVPSSFTVTANVDISGALAAIATLNNNMPHSPAREGPFSTLPDWEAVFTSFGPAVDGAIGQLGRFGAATKAALSNLTSGNVAVDVGASAGAIMRRFAANFDIALDTMRQTASAAGDFLTQAQAYKDLILMAVTAIKQAQAALSTVNTGLSVPALQGGGDQAGQALGNGVAQGVRRALDIHSPSAVMAAIGADVVAGLVQGMDGAQQDAAKKAADVASAIAQAISAGVAAFGSLSRFVAPDAGNIAAFGQTLRLAVDDLAVLSEQVGAAMLAAAATFAEGAGKAVGLYSSGISAFAGLRDYVRPAASAIYDFGKDLRLALNDLALLAEQLTTDTSDLAGRFGEGVSKATGGIVNAVAGFVALRDYARVPAAALYDFGKDLRLLVQDFAAIVDIIGVDMVEQAGRLGDSVGKITGGIAGAVAGFAALRDFARVPAAAIDAFAASLDQLLARLATVAAHFQGPGLAATAALGEALGKITGGIGGAVSGLTSLLTFISPPVSAMDAFAASVHDIIARMVTVAATLATDGVAAAAALGDGFAKVFAGLNAGTSFFKSLDNILLPDQAGIDRILAPMLAVVGTLANAARQFDPATLATTGALADLLSKVFAAVQAGNQARAPVATSGGGGGGGGNTYIYEFNMQGAQISGFDQFEDQVVSAIEDARRRGRIT